MRCPIRESARNSAHDMCEAPGRASHRSLYVMISLPGLSGGEFLRAPLDASAVSLGVLTDDIDRKITHR